MNTTDQTNQQVPHQGATMTTEPITTADVLNVTRAVHDIAQTMSVTLLNPAALLGARRAQSYRAAADLLEAFGKATTPGILRREADRIDPPTVPAEPDLTTADGWYAEADAFGWWDESTDDPTDDGWVYAWGEPSDLASWVTAGISRPCGDGVPGVGEVQR